MKKVLLISLILRIFLIFLSKEIINYDINSYFLVGKSFFEKINIYNSIAKLHYPYFPFFIYIEAFSYYLGKDIILTSIIIKLFNTIFDLGNVYLIYLISNKNEKKAFLYSINPISLLIFSFHGQFDALCIFFLLLSLYYLKTNEKISILFYSISIMIKTWPLLFIFYFYKTLRNKKIFFLVPFFPLISIFLYSFFFNSKIFDILKTILSYQGVWGVWGISLLFKNLKSLYKKLFIFGFLLIFFIKTLFFIKEKNIFRNIYKSLLFFIIFSPTFSIQYFSWFIPFFILVKSNIYLVDFFYIFFITFYLIFNYYSWINYYYQSFFDLISFSFWFVLLSIFLWHIKKNRFF